MIRISGLKKSFKNICVLNDINLTVDKGDIYGLVGLSGAGKSTILRCINGLETYDAGSLSVNGIDVKECIEKGEIRHLRKDIGMIFQHFALLERMTAYENIALPMTCWKYEKAYMDQRVKELLKLVGLEDRMQAKPRELSGGQKQRVAIARALTMNPKILLCDEATSALDPVTTESILVLLRDINEQMGVTVVIVTHEMSVVKQVCNKIAALENGRIRNAGCVEDVFLKQTNTLNNIVGNYVGEQLRATGANIKIILRDEEQDQDILSRIAIDTKMSYRVDGCSFDRYRNRTKGYYIINIRGDEKERLIHYLESEQVEWEEMVQNGAR